MRNRNRKEESSYEDPNHTPARRELRKEVGDGFLSMIYSSVGKGEEKGEEYNNTTFTFHHSNPILPSIKLHPHKHNIGTKRREKQEKKKKTTFHLAMSISNHPLSPPSSPPYPAHNRPASSPPATKPNAPNTSLQSKPNTAIHRPRHHPAPTLAAIPSKSAIPVHISVNIFNQPAAGARTWAGAGIAVRY